MPDPTNGQPIDLPRLREGEKFGFYENPGQTLPQGERGNRDGGPGVENVSPVLR